ncbi:MAG: hypothetical protein WEB00_12035 [Dehalococcoidia bacterium]
MTRGNVVQALYALALATIVIAVAFTIYYYFGDPDQWEQLRAGFGTLTALSSLLRDLVVLGVGLGALLGGLAWHLDKDRAESRSSIVMSLYGVGALSLIVGIVYALNQYFGNPEQWDAIEARDDTLGALLSFLRDLVPLGMAPGTLLLALGWHVERGRGG